MVYKVPTFTANIFIGVKDTTEDIYPVSWLADIETICQEYVDRENLCVTVTPTKFFYTNGNEPGATVGLINYPRFPSKGSEIKEHAFILARQLKENFKQKRVSIVCSDETFMIGEIEGD